MSGMLSSGQKQLFFYLLQTEFTLKRLCSSSIAAVARPEVRKQVETKKDEELSKSGPRMNPVGVQMLSQPLYKQIFGQSGSREDENSIKYQKRVNRAINHLKQHGLWGKKVNLLPEVNFKIPELRGNNLDEHFRCIASEQTEPYRKLLEKLTEKSIPPIPNKWNFQKGWTKYLSTGEVQLVDFPDDTALVLDVEVCVTEGRIPTLATAVSPTAWYSWCSHRLTDDQFKQSVKAVTDDLIPLETKCGQVEPPDGIWEEKIVVGHNVSFDRTFLKEQYYLKGSNVRFLDTMSLHIAVSGMANNQRILRSANAANSNRKDIQEAKSKLFGRPVRDWMSVTTANNLADVYQFYCDGHLKKDERNVFVKGSMDDIRGDFQNLMTYCSKDVLATHAVLGQLLPLFYERFPHPVTLAGMLEMSVAYLPVNENWGKYLSKVQSTYDDLQREMKLTLMHLADEARQLLENNKYENDCWLWDLDWTIKKLRKKKSEPQAPVNILPEWYRKLCSKKEDVESNWPTGKPVISTQMRIAPKLLRLTWDGFPLHYDAKHGWGYLVPKNLKQKIGEEQTNDIDEDVLENSDITTYKDLGDFMGDPEELTTAFQSIVIKKRKSKKTEEANVTLETDVEVRGCKFYRLPHKNGPKFRVGSPLAKEFLTKIEDGTLRAESGIKAHRILGLGKMSSYWKNAQKRILSQVVVWLKEKELSKATTRSSDYHEENSYGAILPQIVTAGTLTRRAVEPTWLTASNAYIDRVGSELKSMIYAPPGYRFVGADVDSQEIWIAAILGDANFAGIHGCTACGWMCLQGNKKDGTDIHSHTAKTVGISRDHAKVMNYGRIYGAGQKYAKLLIKQFNHRLTLEEASVKAQAMFAATKGVKGYSLNETGIEIYNEWKSFEDTGSQIVLTRGEIYKMLTETYSPLSFTDVISKSVWVGGTESSMFNQLEAISKSDEPRTPVLGCRITRPLEPGVVNENFMTSRVNWVVQSSGVDYLHLMLVGMRWLCSSYKIDSRFSISIHDEVRYLVKEEDKYRASLALQITNLLTRAMFAYKIGMNDLPQSVAFFSAVDIDKVLRKEVTMDCQTPSNPDGLAKGYGIPAGEALDIYEVVKITNGSLENDNCENKHDF